MFVIPDKDGNDVAVIEIFEGVWEAQAVDGGTFTFHGDIAEVSKQAREVFDDPWWDLDNEDGVSYNELEAGWPWDEDEVERGFNEAHARSEEEGYARD